MKSFSRRGLLLFGVMLAVCAFVPSLASAANWSPIGSTHHLFSPNLASFVTSGPFGVFGWSCRSVSMDADVVSANTIEITSAGFQQPCMGTGNPINCTTTPVGTFPWTATATSTTNVQIHGVNVTMTFENTPGNPTVCGFGHSTLLLTGTVAGGSWNPASNELTLSGLSGLAAHFLGFGGTNLPVFWTATFRATSGTLRMSM